MTDEAAPHIRLRRTWCAPLLLAHSTLTDMTQMGPHAPLALLFQVASSPVQCFDQNGQPLPHC